MKRPKMLSAKTLIAIPAYNAEEFIARTLRSCVNQTLKSAILVVDNCSTDNTREIVKEFQEQYDNIQLVVNEWNLGRVGNWNRCLELFNESESEYIKFLFTGDTIKPNCIEEVEKVFKQYPDLGAVFWSFEFKKDDSISIARDYEESRYLPPAEINELNISNEGGRLGAIVANVYSKKGIVESGAYFNEVFIGKADFDYRVLQHHGAFYLNEVLSTFNVEHCGTFQYALDNYKVNIEVSFNRACALERSRDILPLEKYKRFRNKIILDTLRKNIHFLGRGDLIAILGIVSTDLYVRLRRTLGKIKQYARQIR